MIPLRRTLPGLLCAILVVAVGGSGCREAPSVRIDLTSYLPVARTASLSKRQRGLAALEPDASGRSFEQPAGVALSWYFALPRAARKSRSCLRRW